MINLSRPVQREELHQQVSHVSLTHRAYASCFVAWGGVRGPSSTGTTVKLHEQGHPRPLTEGHELMQIDPLGVPPVPPGAASVHANGSLKDTAANRALHPTPTPDHIFNSDSVLQESSYADPRTVVFEGDVLKVLQFMANEGIEVDTIVTSPPFYGQRDYGVAGQIGLEAHPQEFIEHLVEVFQAARAVLKDTGSLFVNLGDTYWSGKGAHKSTEAKQGARRFGIRPQDRPGDGHWARPKQLLLIPHRFAIAMQDAGWLVRNDNVWIKPNPVPDQVRDRSSMSHEYVFHFTKSRWYYYDRAPVGRPGKRPGSVLPPPDTWFVAPSRGRGPHRAKFSAELVKIPILATTPLNGVVLDPFAGSGTTLRFARSQSRRSIGIDLSPEYVNHMVTELRADAVLSDEYGSP